MGASRNQGSLFSGPSRKEYDILVLLLRTLVMETTK